MSAGALERAPMSLRATEAARLRTALMLSAIVHVAIGGAWVFWSTRPEPPRPPVYRVNLIGAPKGPVQSGVVAPQPSAPSESKAPAPSGAEQIAPPPKAAPNAKSVKAAPPPKKATPTPAKSKTAGTEKASASKTAPPVAGSGEKGGKGADVANIRLDGIAFPDEGYLNNIVRQIRIAWQPRRTNAALVSELRFTLHRDGSVSDIQVLKSSNDRLYDIEARGAIESVGTSRKFGPLPAVWKDDVLIVYFTFDYALLR